MRGGWRVAGGVGVVGVVTLSVLLLRPGPTALSHSAEKPSAPVPTPPATPAPEKTLAASDSKTPLLLLGSVQSAGTATLSVRMPARVVAVSVQNGEAVHAGQVVVQLDAAEARTQEETAQAGVAAAMAQLHKAQTGQKAQRTKADADVSTARSGLKQAQVKRQQAILARDAAQAEMQSEMRLAQEGVRKAEAALKLAQKSLKGLEELATVGGVSRNDLEGARTQVTVAQSDLETAQTQLRRLQAGPSGEAGLSYRVALAQKDAEAAEAGVHQAEEGLKTALTARNQIKTLATQEVQAAQAALRQAQAGVRGAKTLQEMTRLVSPLMGVATNVTARVGETAQPGMPLVTIVSLAGLRVEALVPARLLTRLRVGQNGQVTSEAHPGRTFPVTLHSISHLLEPDGRSFRVKLSLPASTPLRPGQNVRVTLAP